MTLTRGRACAASGNKRLDTAESITCLISAQQNASSQVHPTPNDTVSTNFVLQ